MSYAKPLPVVDALSRPFWDACRRHELVSQCCLACTHRWWPIGPACTRCLSSDFTWEALSGAGVVESWIVYHHAFHPAFADDLPYNVALIRVDEGFAMVSSVVDAVDIAVGQRVQVTWDDVTDEFSIPRFRPA